MDLECASKNFVQVADEVCSQIERFNLGNTQPLLTVLIALLREANELAQHSVSAGDFEFDESDAYSDKLTHIPNDVTFQVVFDPLDPESVCAISLKDALDDIYRSLKSGLRVIQDQPEKEQAVISGWKQDYELHWGRHLVDVIRFLVLCGNQANFLSQP